MDLHVYKKFRGVIKLITFFTNMAFFHKGTEIVDICTQYITFNVLELFFLRNTDFEKTTITLFL